MKDLRSSTRTMWIVVFVLISMIIVSEGFRVPSWHRFSRPRPHLLMSTTDTNNFEIVSGKKWPGNRPPCSNPMLEGLKMDATWGRGKLRDEIWEDNLSPNGEWWRAYNPSEEEIEAMQLGYDFSNPKKWHEERGLDFDSAWKETQRLMKLAYEEYKQNRIEMVKMLKESPQKFDELKTRRQQIIANRNNSTDLEDYTEEEVSFLRYFYELRCTRDELNYRRLDDERQKLKGQPSLDSESTGEEYLNAKS